MAKLSIKGKATYYNPVDNTIIIKLDNMDPSIHASIEDIVANYNKYMQMDINYNVKDSIKDSYRKLWYQFVHDILVYNETYPNAESMRELDEQLRESIFPLKGDDIPEPKRMRNMTADELKKCIEILQSRYKEVLIDNQI